MVKQIKVESSDDILPKYRNTPIERLFLYHNLGIAMPATYGCAEMLIGMCMDHRKDMIIPNEFAYVMRGAGANMRGREFEISYAIAVGGVATIALLAHTDCGMSHVTEKRELFVSGLTKRAGTTTEAAEAQFDQLAPKYHIGDAIEFVLSETARLEKLYPQVLIAPILYTVADDRLIQLSLE